MQVMVQGAWGVIPVHLNELSPNDARGTFPGFVVRLGNLIASVNAPLQASIAVSYGGPSRPVGGIRHEGAGEGQRGRDRASMTWRRLAAETGHGRAVSISCVGGFPL
jgi:hypothetical protein